jgi:hypothetical protein
LDKGLKFCGERGYYVGSVWVMKGVGGIGSEGWIRFVCVEVYGEENKGWDWGKLVSGMLYAVWRSMVRG